LERTSDAVYTVDRDWQILSWNRVMAERTGVQAERVVGRSLWVVSEELLAQPIPAELETRYRTAMETGEAAEFRQHIPPPLDYWVEIRVFPDENGLSVFSRDVTDQVQRTRQLERQEFLFQRAQDLSNMGIWEWNPQTETLWWSDGIRRIHGVDAGYTPTLDEALAFYHPDDRAVIEAAVQQAIDSGTGYEEHLRIVRPDGAVRHVLARGETMTDAEGAVRLLRGTFQDVTDLERTKRELQAQNERLDRFSDVVAHDIRNPLSVAMAFTSLAQDTSDLAHLDRVEAAQQRIAELVHDLMLLARTSKHAADKEPVCLADIARRAWTNVDAPTLTLEVDAALPTVEGHAGLLTELFENLYRNAAEHGGAGITVRVGPLENGGFCVEDTGPGIPKAAWERVFEHGYSTHDEGTGFGLSIVAEIAAAHGWSPTAGPSREGGARLSFSPEEDTPAI
jgi:PAS domain S-box-containing protein